MERNTTHVRISKRTKKELDKYIRSCNIRVYLGDLVDYAVQDYLDRVTGGPPLRDRAGFNRERG